MIFYYDQLTDAGIPVPNTVKNLDNPDTEWPRTVQLRLLRMFNWAEIDYQITSIDKYNTPGWYPIGIGWFDFDVDYIALMSETARQLIEDGALRILFYYHEGDNPAKIKERLDQLCVEHNLPEQCYLFVSANTAATDLNNFVYFGDHECFFNYINRNQLPISNTARTPSRQFTALTRIPKDWRSVIMSQLWKRGILENSLWSFNTTEEQFGLSQKNNPIDVTKFINGRKRLKDFVDNYTPKRCDVLDSVEQNDHTVINTDLYLESFCSIVLETVFEADRSGGTFLTEKIWKCVKYGQPFVVAAPSGTIQHLRDLGYNMYDEYIDHTYDTVEDATERAKALLNEIDRLNTTVSPEWYQKLNEQRIYNIRFFKTRYQTALNTLAKELL